jgi:hypothetical protein
MAWVRLKSSSGRTEAGGRYARDVHGGATATAVTVAVVFLNNHRGAAAAGFFGDEYKNA